MERKEKIEKLIEVAKAQLGKPYQYGAYRIEDKNGDDPDSFDCSSLIQFCFKKVGLNDFPRSSIEQAAFAGEEISDINEAQAGDLIFFEGVRGHYNHRLFNGRKLYIGHVALYLGDNTIIHAVDRDHISGVVLQKLQELANYPNWPNNIVLIKRYL